MWEMLPLMERYNTSNPYLPFFYTFYRRSPLIACHTNDIQSRRHGYLSIHRVASKPTASHDVHLSLLYSLSNSSKIGAGSIFKRARNSSKGVSHSSS